jgi:hypothetical protein
MLDRRNLVILLSLILRRSGSLLHQYEGAHPPKTGRGYHNRGQIPTIQLLDRDRRAKLEFLMSGDEFRKGAGQGS